MVRMVLGTIALLAVSAPAVWAASVEGRWKTEAGAEADLYRCANGATCVKLVTGPYAGTVISRDLVGEGESLSGTLLNPEDGRTYSGRATPQADGTLRLKGCALKIFCKTQVWTRID